MQRRAVGLRRGRLDHARLDQAATRMLALLLPHKAQRLRSCAPDSGASASRAVSGAAVTVATGPCSGALVGRRVHVTGPASVVATFRRAAQEAGLAAGGEVARCLWSAAEAPRCAVTSWSPRTRRT